ncbi:RHS repeat-associated core domain-containing protein [Dactylosporangium sp. CA-092794]|uniref:RHS repeat-associated core domain-containing protein n=1 Tax=Dactylosporangium sp. CA-092794 TaxID=3239929 RepID=UPI003D91B122
MVLVLLAPPAGALADPPTGPEPYLSVAGEPLDGIGVEAPFTVELSDADAVSGEVTWLVDDHFVGKDSAAPYTWVIPDTLTDGKHKVKARWVTSPPSTDEVSAYFWLGGPWQPPKTVYEEPAPSLESLWVTADNRREPVAGLYDWSKAGFGGGTVLPTDANVRPEAQCRITPEELRQVYGVVPNDGGDDTNGLQDAIDDIKAVCSPTGDYTKSSRILLPTGTLNIDHELSIDADYLIIRGAGSDPATGTRFVYRPNADTRYDTITSDGSRWDQDAMTSGDANGGWLWPGRGLFRVQSRAVDPRYAAQYAAAPANRKDLFEGTVNDHWTSGLRVRGKPGDPNFAGRKGDTVVYLAADASFDNLKVGGLVNVMAANSEKFYAEMQALPTKWPLDNLHMRQQIFMVTAGDPFGKTLTLDKPLEYDLPVNSTSDGSPALNGAVFDSKVTPLVDAVVGVGLEDLYFTQEMPQLDRANASHNYGNMDPAAAMHGIVFKWSANSWVKGVRAEMTGSHPIVTEVASNLSIVDNYLDGSWNKGKGGNGYFRGSRVWDSVYAGNTTRNLRHFTFQWSASGNVAIGNSFDSDLNLHGGYERNNLFELNEVSTPYAHRSDSCQSNCGGEGGDSVEDAGWYPIWWAAGKKAVKWSGSSGPNNVFFNNHLRKQLDNDTTPYVDYAPYGTDRQRIFRFGSDSSGGFKHLAYNGEPIADWAGNETRDYTAGAGVDASRTDPGRSLFLKSVSLSGYGGPHPQPLRRTWGCSCWDGRGWVNTRLAADPVNTATGGLMETFTDASIAGLGRFLDWGRTYNSLDLTDGPLGRGWQFSYNPSVTAGTDNTVMIRDGTGGQSQYRRNADNSYSAVDPGVTATLTDRPGGGWLLRNRLGDELLFDSAGRLVADRDEQGRGVTLAYAGGRLQTVTDGFGQTFTLHWGDTGPAAGRITQITGSDGHSVGYGYTSTAGESRLTSVTGVDGKTTSYSYDPATGYLNGITDPVGNVLARTVYDPVTGRAVQQTDGAGGVWRFAWDPGTETATITDPTGRVSKDVYQGNVLVSQLDADGRSADLYYNADNHVIAENTTGQELTRDEYDGRGNLTRRTYPPAEHGAAPATETWTYDTGNRVTAHTDVFGKVTGYEYDGQGRLTKTTYPDGTTVTTTYTALGQPRTVTDQLGRTTTLTYDASGNLIQQAEPGDRVTTYSYDAAHNKLSETDPRGNVAGADDATRERYTSHWTYDAVGRVLTATDALDHTTTYTYTANGEVDTETNPSGGVTRYTYDGNDNVLTTTDPNDRVTTNTYDAAGRLASVTDAEGGKTTYSYDANGNLAAETGPGGNVTGVDQEARRRNTTTYAYDAEGRPTQTRVVDPQRPDRYLVTTTEYDGRGLPVAVTDPGGGVIRTVYDLAGRPVRTTDPTGVVSTVSYDDLGREKTRSGGGTTVTNTYDAAGRLQRTETAGGAATSYTYSDDDNVRTVTAPGGLTTTFEYDTAGNRTRTIDPLNRSARTLYNSVNGVTKTIDPAGKETAYGYDSSGHVNKVTDANGGITQYAYDKAGQLKTLTTPKGGAYTYTYTKTSQVKTVTTPAGRVTSYTYTPDGQPKKATLPSGSITYSYDEIGRPTKIDYSDASADVTFSYDKAGRVQTVGNGITTAEYGYDPAGRTVAINRGTQRFAYDWDDQGRLAKRTLPDGRSQSYTYGSDARLDKTTLTAAATSRDISYGYDAAQRLQTITRSDGPTTTRGYDNAGRITTLRHADGGGHSLVQQNVTWTAADNPDTITTTRGTATTVATYSYDNTGQVTQLCLPTTGVACAATDPRIGYGYDLNGNRTSTTKINAGTGGSTISGYDADDRPTTSADATGTTTYTYDANGNLAGQTSPAGTRTYAYGLDANLRTVGLEDGRAIGYTYDEAGNRTSRTVNGAADAAWTWDTLGDLATRLDETTAGGATTHQWWADPVSALGTAVADTAGPTPIWLLGDYQGSITDAATAAGLTSSQTLDPFGNPVSGTSGGPLGFHGQYRDDQTGLYDVRARDYDPATGRFTAPDPVAADPGTPFAATYHYGYNRPGVFTDPSGQWVNILIGAGVGALVGGAVSGIVDCAIGGKRGWDCAKSVAVGAAWGAAAGALMSVGLPAGVTAFAGRAGPWGLRAAAWGFDALVGGVANVGAGATNAYLNGHGYSGGQAAADFGIGAAGALGGRALTKLGGKAWNALQRKFFGPKPANPATAACDDAGGEISGGTNPSAPAGSGSPRYSTPSTPGMRSKINPGGGTRNCGGVACAGDATLGGNPTSVGPADRPLRRAQMEKLMGRTFVRVRDLDDLVDRVESWGSGARGVVGAWPAAETKPGHYFNVVNNSGHVSFFDFQSGQASHVDRWDRYYLMRTN